MKRIWNWYYGKASIRKKLVLSYLSLVLLPILGLGVYSYYISTENLMYQTRQTIESNISSISYGLNSNIKRENDNIKYLSYNSKFREKLQDGAKDATGIAEELTQSVEPIFWYFITSDDNIKGIKIYSPYIHQGIGSFLKPINDYERRSWYEENKMNFKTHWFFEDEKIFATRILLDAETSSQPIGLMSLEVYPKNFCKPVTQSDFLNNGVILVDSSGLLIKEKRISDENLNSKITDFVLNGVESGSYETDEYMLSVSEPLTNGWKIAYYIDKEEISDQMMKIIETTAGVMLICLIAVTVLISMISKLLSSRILRLKGLAEQVSSGDFHVELHTCSTDEIGTVESSFVKMSRRIRDMMEEMYQLGLEKRAEELKALQAMINPHFLYNCLSSIKWKAIRAEQDEIADITGLIAKFYRTTLNGGKQITTVRNELDNIKSYLEIQSRSHEDRFDIEYLLDTEGMEYEMPNFLLQPIVENAIIHGVDYCDEDAKGRIIIEYKCDKEYLVFNIYNNGPAVEKEAIEKILTTPGKGYGIYNIRERIRMYYRDENCGLFASVTDDYLVCFTVRLGRKPIIKES